MAEGLFRPGDQLPSESQLCRRYRVSPMTVRRAINLLADQGVISTARGRGTFVKPVEIAAATFGLGELQDLFSHRQNATVKLLEVHIVPADERTARKLALKTGSRVIYIRSLLSAQEKLTSYHREYLVYDPARPIVEAGMEVTSLQGLLSGTGDTILKRGDLDIQATVLNDEEACLLQSSAPAAAFCIEHVFYDFDNRPVSWGWFICRGDQLHFSTTIGLP
ncbi:MAG: GntR family transcriptional regulator [Chloroflexi bacterium]|nr:GntR family transcriptional regulator [Chloroflexota bacterium]